MRWPDARQMVGYCVLAQRFFFFFFDFFKGAMAPARAGGAAPRDSRARRRLIAAGAVEACVREGGRAVSGGASVQERTGAGERGGSAEDTA